jgi:hypothetical protein
VGENDFFKVKVDPISRDVIWEGGVHMDPDVLYRNIAGRDYGVPLH